MAAKLARTLPSASTSIAAPLASTSTAPAATVAGQPEAFRRPLRAPIAPRFGARPPRTGRRTVDASSVELMPTPEARPERTRVSGWTARRGGRSTVFDPSESEIVATVGRFTAPIQLPPRLAVRACTHKSIVEGTTRNHNGRLAFMGSSSLDLRAILTLAQDEEHCSSTSPPSSTRIDICCSRRTCRSRCRRSTPCSTRNSSGTSAGRGDCSSSSGRCAGGRSSTSWASRRD